MAGQNTSQPNLCDPRWTWHLTGLYIAVFIGGVTGIICILFVLVKMNSKSVTTTAVINLVVVHSVFLLTVPFRLVYLVQEEWFFGMPFCKVVSAMLHVHMYLTFLFYVGILAVRYLTFFKRKDKVEFYRKLHAVAASTALWVLVLVTVMPPLLTQYGSHGEYKDTKCFQFQEELKETYVKVLNYVVVVAVIAIAMALLAFQVFIIVSMGKKLHHSWLAHQEFWAQLKNLIFIGVIFVCFLPYQFFRLYYLQHHGAKGQCHSAMLYNEIFLSVTAISCFDLLLFVLWGSRWFKQNITELLNCLPCC
ncbi:probable G-protein coupled receptor 141 [Dromiciops gliroides]|uniref:probable G-protein coupled receptor 141 n=1 Tax=Dromiciops gliroides TaxID=33562 RepID=UPI001CC55178|nr:probable G-protein coupled receptor 141 [Dromiciops gliroides]XP_043832036.1 probable G-protein coupled receptor 141 [Dromiciops gliroides]XP_043832037.1 probable G-protein coupled receptor 141 [Dromiciops gliroides]XP_043832038.1 probable G-protein coupled receptor 141 [Dromiciops gliroides]